MPGVRSPGNRPMISLQSGDRVSHDSFGLGTVVRVEGKVDKAMAHVDFGADTGVKRLLLRYAPLSFEGDARRRAGASKLVPGADLVSGQPRQRVDSRAAVGVDLEVQMRSGRVSGVAGSSDDSWPGSTCSPASTEIRDMCA